MHWVCFVQHTSLGPNVLQQSLLETGVSAAVRDDRRGLLLLTCVGADFSSRIEASSTISSSSTHGASTPHQSQASVTTCMSLGGSRVIVVDRVATVAATVPSSARLPSLRYGKSILLFSFCFVVLVDWSTLSMELRCCLIVRVMCVCVCDGGSSV